MIRTGQRRLGSKRQPLPSVSEAQSSRPWQGTGWVLTRPDQTANQTQAALGPVPGASQASSNMASAIGVFFSYVAPLVLEAFSDTFDPKPSFGFSYNPDSTIASQYDTFIATRAFNFTYV